MKTFILLTDIKGNIAVVSVSDIISITRNLTAKFDHTVIKFKDRVQVSIKETVEEIATLLENSGTNKINRR